MPEGEEGEGKEGRKEGRRGGEEGRREGGREEGRRGGGRKGGGEEGGREEGGREEGRKGKGREERKRGDCYLLSTMLTDCHVTYQSHLCACNGTTAVNVESSTGIGLGKFVLLLSIVHMGHSIPADGDRKGREGGKEGEKEGEFEVIVRPDRHQSDCVALLSSHHAL